MNRLHPSDSVPSIASFDHTDVRQAIDRIVTLRMLTVRVGYYALLLHRPNPQGTDSPAQRDMWLESLRESVASYGEVTELLEIGTALANVEPGISAWIYNIVRDFKVEVGMVSTMNRLTQQIGAHALDAGPEQNARMLNHVAESRGGFYEAVASIFEALQLDLEEARSKGLRRAASSAIALATRLNRLERIGKHVRIVSLNASVEAARVGDAGRGLSVIASEFKTLAEEITEIARDAKNDIDAFS